MVNLSSILNPDLDPTLLAIDKELVKKKALEPKREYLGASSIGHSCNRKLWYSIQKDITRKSIEASGVRAIEDGYHGEDVMASRLRMVPEIELWTHDEYGEQFGVELFGGKVQCHVDGVIRGLLQCPKTTSVWEHKQVNETKFNKFKKLKQTIGEKNTLADWDPIYFAQSQIVMYMLELDRHYLTVATPGGRDYNSCRTELNKPMAKALIDKAQRIVFAKDAPDRVSEDSSYFVCRFCEYSGICHAK